MWKKCDLTLLNIIILITATVVNGVCLYIASHSGWGWTILAMLIFSLSNNTMFSLLHECVHDVFSPSTTLNRWVGRYTASWFPTGFAVQRAYHLLHHRNNRSASEQFDVLHEHDVRWLKYAQWYAIFSGLYWVIATIGVLIFALTPKRWRDAIVQLLGKQGGVQTGGKSYIGALNALPPIQARAEVWGAMAFQLMCFVVLDLSVSGWLLCYASFGLQWSSLQYTDHAYSPLDRRNGAWNLIVPKFIRLIFLNYHYHLAHHQYPQIAWRDLPKYAETGVRFRHVWQHCLRGPKPVEHFPTFPTESLKS